MSGGTVRDCTTCRWKVHCLLYDGVTNRQNCPDWKPRPAPEERETPVAGCEYCRPPVALYQQTHNTKLSLGTFGNARTLETACEPCPPYSRCSSRGSTFRSAFVINYCPNCGRDLRGE